MRAESSALIGSQPVQFQVGARFMLIVHHTDAEREFAYDRQSRIGRLDMALDEANARLDCRRYEKRLEANFPVRSVIAAVLFGFQELDTNRKGGSHDHIQI